MSQDAAPYDNDGWRVDPAAQQAAIAWARANSPDTLRNYQDLDTATMSVEAQRKVAFDLIDHWRRSTNPNITHSSQIQNLTDDNHRRQSARDAALSTAPLDSGLRRLTANLTRDGRQALALDRASRAASTPAQDANRELSEIVHRANTSTGQQVTTRQLIDEWRSLDAARTPWLQWTDPAQQSDLAAAIDSAQDSLNTEISHRVGVDWATLEAVAATNIHPAVETISARDHLDAVLETGGDLVADGILNHPDRAATLDLVDAATKEHRYNVDRDDTAQRWRDIDRAIVDRFTGVNRADTAAPTPPTPASGVIYTGPAVAATSPERTEHVTLTGDWQSIGAALTQIATSTSLDDMTYTTSDPVLMEASRNEINEAMSDVLADAAERKHLFNGRELAQGPVTPEELADYAHIVRPDLQPEDIHVTATPDGSYALTIPASAAEARDYIRDLNSTDLTAARSTTPDRHDTATDATPAAQEAARVASLSFSHAPSEATRTTPTATPAAVHHDAVNTRHQDHGLDR